ncbi:hypothetical protein HPB50_026127 [Hyalomma asiaticum]|uniref:Uncharacterized protein n=1 Tax=Hyalomma asiaticum TaxID=266040 RepID=A0ACB7S9S3_HYAAI|nr:hypothetical protein HPB50_026127 [Hyalomma asiaticum]
MKIQVGGEERSEEEGRERAQVAGDCGCAITLRRRRPALLRRCGKDGEKAAREREREKKKSGRRRRLPLFTRPGGVKRPKRPPSGRDEEKRERQRSRAKRETAAAAACAAPKKQTRTQQKDCTRWRNGQENRNQSSPNTK